LVELRGPWSLSPTEVPRGRRLAGLPLAGVCFHHERNGLQNVIRRCSKEDHDQLAAFLALLRQQRDPEYLATLDGRINDRDPRHWVSLEALKQQFRNR
jgi:hypothetical protein